MVPEFTSVWMVFTGVLTPVACALLILVWNGRRQDATNHKEDIGALYTELNKVKSDLVDHRVHVAENYVTIAKFERFEQTMVDAMQRIESKVDKILINKGTE